MTTGRHLWEAHPHVRSGTDLSFGERAADRMKAAFGRWSALGLVIAAITCWLLFVRDPGELHLNLALSCMAGVQGFILQIAANRGDRIAAEVAKGTHDNTALLLELQQQQMEILAALGRPKTRTKPRQEVRQ